MHDTHLCVPCSKKNRCWATNNSLCQNQHHYCLTASSERRDGLLKKTELWIIPKKKRKKKASLCVYGHVVGRNSGVSFSTLFYSPWNTLIMLYICPATSSCGHRGLQGLTEGSFFHAAKDMQSYSHIYYDEIHLSGRRNCSSSRFIASVFRTSWQIWSNSVMRRRGDYFYQSLFYSELIFQTCQ